MTTDDHGTAFVCGDFNQDTSFADHTLATRGRGDVFLADFDSKGNLKWVRKAGGKLNDNAYPIAVRATVELIIGGACNAPTMFGWHEVTKSSSSDLYASKWKLKSVK